MPNCFVASFRGPNGRRCSKMCATLQFRACCDPKLAEPRSSAGTKGRNKRDGAQNQSVRRGRHCQSSFGFPPPMRNPHDFCSALSAAHTHTRNRRTAMARTKAARPRGALGTFRPPFLSTPPPWTKTKLPRCRLRRPRSSACSTSCPVHLREAPRSM